MRTDSAVALGENRLHIALAFVLSVAIAGVAALLLRTDYLDGRTAVSHAAIYAMVPCGLYGVVDSVLALLRPRLHISSTRVIGRLSPARRVNLEGGTITFELVESRWVPRLRCRTILRKVTLPLTRESAEAVRAWLVHSSASPS